MKEGIIMKKRILSLLLAFALCLTLATSLCACSGDEQTKPTEIATQAVTDSIDPLWKDATYLEDVTLGEGKTAIEVEVQAGEKAITVTINTDAENLEDALTGVDLVQGDESEYGLYIKTVNGILADYDVDQSYWAINKDGEYMMEGANTAQIEDGERYQLVYTK
ncbi:MAG: DUF4430 domain-containing protein [Ruminococcus sp.]|nr:DUF4430 domain-containing protein [Ruminococcus sp.]